MASPILYSWVNHILAENYGERGLIISPMMTFGLCAQIWVPLFTFPTVQAPRFPSGYPVRRLRYQNNVSDALLICSF